MATGKKILFFIAGSSPTDQETKEAEKLGTRMFRNASFFNEFDAVEICDAVAGLAPEVYKKRFEYLDAPTLITAPVTTQNPAPTTGGTPWSGQNK